MRRGELLDALGIAFDALRANRARGMLTTAGIIIGIVAVVVTMAAANGLQNRFRESFSSVGVDVIYVSRMPWIVMNDFFKYRNRRGITLREARELEDRFRGRAVVNPSMHADRDVQFRSETLEGVTIIGTTEKQLQMSTGQPEIGRYLLPFDVAYKNKVCVLGYGVAHGLFPGVGAVGKEIKIGRATFRVIGVMEKQGGSFLGGPDFDRQVFVPITSFVRAFAGNHAREDVTLALKRPSGEAPADFEYAAIGEMRQIRRLHPTTPDDFSINKLDTLVSTFNNMMGVVLIAGLIITSISLFVGAVGVMNIMFVTVTERTREIGVRMAIGATRRGILFQFLCESAAICLAGGVLGIVLATGLTAVVNATVMPASVSWPIVAVAVAVSIAVGVAAGVAPAVRGCRLDPVEALRYE